MFKLGAKYVPGIKFATAWGVRTPWLLEFPFPIGRIGSDVRRSVCTLVETSELSVRSSVTSLVTVTDSLAEPTSSTMFRGMTCEL
jgi:hypothetical protein